MVVDELELTCLEIMAVCSGMEAVGPWKERLDSLVERGYAMLVSDGALYRITDAGRAALKEESDATDA